MAEPTSDILVDLIWSRMIPGATMERADAVRLAAVVRDTAGSGVLGTIDTIAEVAALPVGAVVRDSIADVCERITANKWSGTGTLATFYSSDIALPARVLWDGVTS